MWAQTALSTVRTGWSGPSPHPPIQEAVRPVDSQAAYGVLQGRSVEMPKSSTHRAVSFRLL